MTIEEEIREQVVVLKVSGNLISGLDVGAFHDCVKRLVREGYVKVVVDFSRAAWFGSAMLGVMAASYTTLRGVGGDIRLTGVSDHVSSILQVARLNGVFKCAPTVEDAVAGFGQVS